MKIDSSAFGRIGLLGNPSDIYGGKGISFTFDRQVDLSIKKSSDFIIECNGDKEINNFDYNGKHNLVKACLNYLVLNSKDLALEISYSSNIPIGYGFGGSSSIIISLLRGLNRLYDLGFTNYDIAELAMRIESHELSIACGPQDRYAISFGGMLFMDFKGKELQTLNDPFASIELLDVKEMPFFVACSNKPKCSSTVHNNVRERFLNGDFWIKKEMDAIADLALPGKKALLDEDWKKLGELMNKNFELRNKLFGPLSGDVEIYNAAMENCALAAKLVGSGGGLIVLSEDDNCFNALSEKFYCFKPKIVFPD